MVEAQQNIERLEKKRPRISDPKEMEIIREIYFKEPTSVYADMDTRERYERDEKRRKSKRKSSR